MKPFVLLLFLSLSCSLFGQDLDPEQVKIIALRPANPIRPQVKGHQYDPRRPDKALEPFSPDFGPGPVELPQENGLVESQSWLARLSPGLAGAVMGSKGLLDAGIIEYQAGEYEKAKGRFALLIDKGTSEVWEKAVAWQAWTLYKLEEMDASFNLAQDLTQSKAPRLRAEGFYLAGLHFLRSAQMVKLNQWLAKAKKELQPADWNFRLRYLQLVNLVQNKQWKEARTFLADFAQTGITYSPYYGKIKELEGAIAYAENDFPRALTAYKEAQRLSPGAWSKSRHRRVQAWLYYLSGRPTESKRLAGEELALGLSPAQAELTYLLIASKVRLQEGQNLATLLERIPKGSPFSAYASFQIRAFYKNLNQEPKLKAKVIGQPLHFPALRFYTALLEGQAHFLKGQIEAAEKNFLTALSVDSDANLYWIARYDMGLVHLNQGRYPKAARIFKELAQEKNPKNKLWLGYHLLYAYYQQKQAKAFLAYFPQVDLTEMTAKAQWEVHLMKGSLLYGLGRHPEAIQAFLYGWEQGKRPEALGYAAQAYYQQGKYQQALDLAAKHSGLHSKDLLRYRVKSLLALNRAPLAMRILEEERFKGKELLDLHVEVWLVNQKYEKIVQRVTPLLQSAKNDTERLNYHLILGDVYFNQKKYSAAHRHFAATIALAKDPKKQALARFNLAMCSYAAKDMKAFEPEAALALKAALEPPTRYQLTQVLSNHYLESGQIRQSDALLSDYIQHHRYKKNQIRLRQAQSSYDRGNYTLCADQIEVPLEQPNEFESRDQSILFARCAIKSGRGKEVFAKLERELARAKSKYRQGEIALILAEARYHQGSYQASQETLKKIASQAPKKLQLQARLLGAKNLYKLGQFAEGDQTLGDPNQYREIHHYKEALQLQTEMKAQSGDAKSALRNLLRLYYRKGNSQLEKQELLLKLTRLYLQEGDQASAKEYLDKFNPALAPELVDQSKKLRGQLKEK